MGQTWQNGSHLENESPKKGDKTWKNVPHWIKKMGHASKNGSH